MQELKAGFVYTAESGLLTSMDYSESNDLFVFTNSDGILKLYDLNSVEEKKELHCKLYGCHIARFTRSNDAVISSSFPRGHDHAIRLHCLHNNAYLRFFKGHTDTVLSLDMCKTGDEFLSSSKDGTVRLWDLRTERGLGCLRSQTGQSVPFAAFDPTGLVFSAVTDDGQITTYDLRKLAPFSVNKLRPDPAHIRNFSFSPDGKYLAVLLTDGRVVILDSIQFIPISTICGDDTPYKQIASISFSVDSMSILCLTHLLEKECNGAGATCYVFSVKTGKHEQTLVIPAQHISSVSTLPSVAFHPHRFLASFLVESTLSFFIPFH
ncbi:putative Set1 complex component swd2 [Blattamonas nauphoetae]|uniref:Set1 complex component swd2 n=1 Tax=Blattamonas nauphoetae TaxID=2049346 RepID=A0ABQ9Y6H0_9EUKA|nr:putative Set1 complex component swd2 [Blattamonas nauphoetae]